MKAMTPQERQSVREYFESSGLTAKAKPVVHYTSIVHLHKGHGAIIKPVDHPSALVSNTKHIITSPVIAADPLSGRFETENTIYLPQLRTD